MKEAGKLALGIGLAFAGIALVLALFLPKTGYGESFFCQFRLFSPANVSWEGPMEVGTEWTRLPAPSVLKAVPFTQEIWLMANPDTHVLHSKIEQTLADFDYESFWYVSGAFEDVKTAERTMFEVKIEDATGRSVQLIQTSAGYEATGPKSRPALVFDLFHPDWSKRVFSPGFESNAIYVRASRPFKLDAIDWHARHYERNPCKTWAEVPPEKIFNFDELPPPARP